MATTKKSTTPKPKMKQGGSFPDLNKDGKVTKADILKDPKLLIQRVQNELVFQISNEIKGKYNGEFYEWLPSDASEPDPEHQLNYGKVFQIGSGY